jgi:hypothetical protein
MFDAKEGLATLDLTKKSPTEIHEFFQALLAARYKLGLKGLTVSVKKSRISPMKRKRLA